MTDAPAPSDQELREAAEDGLALLLEVEPDQLDGAVLVTRKGKKPPELFQARADSDAAAILGGVAHSAAVRYCDSTLVDYEPSRTIDDGEVMWISTSEVPFLAGLASDVDDLSSLATFDPQVGLRSLKFFVVRMKTPTGTATFYQYILPAQVVARTTRFSLVMRRGMITTPTNHNLLEFDRRVNAAVVGDIAFFTNLREFQRIFEFLEELRAQADETFQAITEPLRIEGSDQMRAAVTGSPIMLAKMASIQRKLDSHPAYRDAMTMPNLIAFIRTRPECGVEIVGEGDDARIVFDGSPRNRFKLLRLLDDDFLSSDLTKLHYEANSKSAPL